VTAPASSTTAIVLNYCRESLAVQCIEALERSVPVAPRILIVDNQSPDGSGERLRARFPQHDYLQTGANLGYAGGNAQGMQRALAAGARYLLVINDDAEVSPTTVAALEGALDADPKAAMAGPTISYDDAARSLCWAGGTIDIKRALGTMAGPPAEVGEQSRACGFVSGCCVMLRAEAVRALGGFEASYFSYGEDVELSVRYARAGWRLLWVPETHVVHHTPWPEPPIAPWKLTLRDRNRRRMVRRHYTLGERVSFAVWFYPSRVVRLAQYLFTLDFARVAAQWRGMAQR
jgi:GT2 family glycosyltransferase